MGALAEVKTQIFDKVTSMVQGYARSGEICLPENYSVGNAMKMAFLELQNVKDRNSRPALEVCTKPSIINALQNMVYQGLNPAKNQCYFIVYGDQLVLQRSYFGSISTAKMVDPSITDICYDVVYQGDVFEYEKKRGKTIIIAHKQKLENVDKENIVAAYCSIFRGDSEDTTIMTMKEIMSAWKMSKMGVVLDSGKLKANSTHDKFTADMAIKTVVNKACKYVINSSNDSTLMTRTAQSTYDDTTSEEEIVENEIKDNANTIYVDFDEPSVQEYEPPQDVVVDTDTGEVQATDEPNF